MPAHSPQRQAHERCQARARGLKYDDARDRAERWEARALSAEAQLNQPGGYVYGERMGRAKIMNNFPSFPKWYAVYVTLDRSGRKVFNQVVDMNTCEKYWFKRAEVGAPAYLKSETFDC